MSEQKTVLILSTFPHQIIKFSLENIGKQYQTLAYQLDKYIRVNAGNKFKIFHQILPPRGTSTRIKNSDEYKKFNCGDFDFIIVCDNRGLYYRPEEFADYLKLKARKAVFTFSSNNAMVGKEDVLFYMVPSGKRNKKGCKFLGWTCDSTLCTSKQLRWKVQILIDHNYYGRHINMVEKDLTENITLQTCDFAKTYKGREIVIRRFIAGGVETMDPDNPTEQVKYIQGKGLSYKEACDVYSNTDVFIVTHTECMGLSVLESAMAGALIVAPEEYIKDELLKYVHHITFKDTIDWEKVIENIDPIKSRKMVMRFDITNFTQRIVDVMNNIDAHKENGLRFKNSHK